MNRVVSLGDIALAVIAVCVVIAVFNGWGN